MLECEDSIRENQKKIKKTLGPGESEVWSGRGGWACPLTCEVFLVFFWFSRVESSPSGHSPRFF